MVAFSKPQLQVIDNCRRSVTWFLRNCGKIKHPAAGILPFEAFGYQRQAIKAFRTNRMNIFKKCRQSGISKISGAFALWFAMFHPHKTILIVSRTDEDAMAFLREHIVFLFEHLPPWIKAAWKPVKQTDHSIVFPNNSIIRSLTSHPDVLRSNASSLNIIDEAAFIQGMDVMWAGGFSCTRYDTLIQTDEGLVMIGDMGDSRGEQWQDAGVHVATDAGFQSATKYYVAGNAPTKIITTERGFEVEGTAKHRIRVIDANGDYVWQHLGNLKPGDIAVSLPGQFRGKRRWLDRLELTPQLAELIGLYIGDGSLYPVRPKRFKIVFDPQDYATRDAMVAQLNQIIAGYETQAYPEPGNGTADLRLNSAPFVDLLVRHGINSKTCPQDAQIPALILQSDKDVLAAFLRGLFDSDGWCSNGETCLAIGMSTSSQKLAEQVQVCLHALGIISTRILKPSSEGRYSDEPHWWVTIADAASKQRFKEIIGFISQRKKDALASFESDSSVAEINHPLLVAEFASAALKAMAGDSSLRRCRDPRKWNLWRIRRQGVVRLDLVRELSEEFGLTDRLSRYVASGFYFDRVANIANGQADTYDLEVPANNTYLANGLVSHNTLQHGGNVIVISTTNGVGNWYWSTWTDAEAGVNKFNPIKIDWWDMDWAIEYYDTLSRQRRRIAPLDDIRECASKQERERYGPYWSPWLEDQWRGLQERGEGWKFEQEVLAQFVGSGNTVLDKGVLYHISTTVQEAKHKASGITTSIHPMTGEELDLDFTFQEADEGFWIWREPVASRPMRRVGNTITDPGAPAHSYVAGVDIATGKSKDYHAIEVFDIDTMEQVAEFMARCLPRELVRFIDWIGRYYNTALLIVERNNGGDTVIDELRYGYSYPRLWRKKDINDRPRPPRSKIIRPLKVAQYGFSTNQSSKATLNKFLIDNIRDEEGGGYTIYSRRLLKQLQTYVRKKDRLGRDTGKTEAEEGAGNYDDLVIAAALALCGRSDAWNFDAGNLSPVSSSTSFKSNIGPTITTPDQAAVFQKQMLAKGGGGLLMPIVTVPDEVPEVSAQRQLDAFTLQLGGGIPISAGRPLITPPKYFYTRKK